MSYLNTRTQTIIAVRKKTGWGLKQAFDFVTAHGDKTMEALAGEVPEPINVRKAFFDLYEAYVSHMKSEYDYPNNPWSPERDNDLVAIRAREALGL